MADVVTQPGFEPSSGLFRVRFRGRQSLELAGQLERIADERTAVEPEEQVGGGEGCTLVAVEKGLGLRDTGRRQGALAHKVSLQIVRGHLWPHQG